MDAATLRFDCHSRNDTQPGRRFLAERQARPGGAIAVDTVTPWRKRG